tara:strand:+ start:58 stop:231 length:174 start_codon:yes stop_codon:yes gene_type:complete
MERMPPIERRLVEELEKMYPPLEYSPDVSKEQWAFRGGQRDVISKLKHILKKQEKGN